MSRRLLSLATLAAVLGSGTAMVNQEVFAQNQSVLAEVYGRGVHAYYAGNYSDAFDNLTSAIDGGTRDPRAYYFRGIVSHLQGRPEQAEADWKEGAELEAAYGGGYYVGRSLSRFQGSARLKLEQIRQQARLEAMTKAAKRSNARMNELNAGGRAPAANRAAPAPTAPANPKVDNPFADDVATGNPEVQNDDVLKDVVGNPFKDETPAPGPAAAAGAAGAAPAGDDPFGGSAPAGGDPFGGGGSDAGGDPFGGGAAGGDDPFGDPF
ncbi:tetratricopeptide repeat protein [Roseiconus lacunae]|uniref:hypothetical protein n=1 Tax=Roseiconus lacunae TaxID=2605694 RepID=UPI00190F3C65|nr:hypothetical protein [Roseiconus lacunae]WRQ50798.1 hypothetical protein U8335_28100 [Stieleria sp. HD01]